MADVKISALPASTTPLAGTEVLPIVQSSTTRQVSVANLTAGRAVNALSITASSLTSGRVTYATTSGLLTDSANLTFNGTQLGVGTASPGATLNVYSGAGLGSIIDSSSASGSYTAYRVQGTNIAWFGAASQVISGASASDFGMTSIGSGAFIFGTGSGSERMRISSAGVVGIGTSSPDASYRLNLSGTNTIFPAVYFNNTTSSKDYSLRVSGTDFILRDNTSGNDRLQVDTSGNLLVGTSSLLQTSNRVSIQKSNTSGGEGVVTINNSDSTASSDSAPPLVLTKAVTTTSSSARFVQFYAGTTATPMGGIVGNGASNVQFAAISDAREKTNVKKINGSLEKITALKPVEFDWIKDNSHVNAGFIAQDVQEIFPEFVVENMAKEGEEQRYGLTGGMTGGIVAHLVSAIQEQQALIESLTTRLTALENK